MLSFQPILPNAELFFVIALHILFFALFAYRYIVQNLRVSRLKICTISSFLLIPWLIAIFVGPFFDGLEYEDAYIHKAAALFQIFHIQTGTDGFWVKTCIAGSISNCIAETSFQTHLIGFSAIMTLSSYIVGWHAHLSNVLSAIFGFLTLMIFWALLKREVSRFESRILGMFLVLTCPTFYIISGSSFAEPAFCFFLTVSTLAFLNLWDNLKGNVSVAIELILYSLSLSLLVLTKEEGILFVGILGIVSFLGWLRDKNLDENSRAKLFMTCISFGVSILSLFWIGSLNSVLVDWSDFKAFPFYPRNLIDVGGVFLSASLSMKYFGGVWILFFISLFWGIKSIKIRTMVPMFTVLIFILMYSMHTRGYWYEAGANVGEEELLRYLYPLIPLACLSIAHVSSQVLDLIPKLNIPATQLKAVMYTFGIGCFIVSLSSVNTLRVEGAEAEVSRKTFPKNLLAVDGYKEKVFLSTRTVALYPYLPNDVVLVDFLALTWGPIQEFVNEKRSQSNLVLLDESFCDNEMVYKRWKKECTALAQLRIGER